MRPSSRSSLIHCLALWPGLQSCCYLSDTPSRIMPQLTLSLIIVDEQNTWPANGSTMRVIYLDIFVSNGRAGSMALTHPVGTAAWFSTAAPGQICCWTSPPPSSPPTHIHRHTHISVYGLVNQMHSETVFIPGGFLVAMCYRQNKVSINNYLLFDTFSVLKTPRIDFISYSKHRITTIYKIFYV